MERYFIDRYKAITKRVLAHTNLNRITNNTANLREPLIGRVEPYLANTESVDPIITNYPKNEKKISNTRDDFY